MRKLVLHSDQIKEKPQMDEAFLKLLDSDSPKIGYIPSCSDLERKYYNKQKDWYRQFGITDLLYFDLDKEFDESKAEEFLQCDAIFLSGGDTRYFLKNLQDHNFISKIRNFVNGGGVLIGTSAGSILMTPSVNITELDHGHDTAKLDDVSALNLVDFEFCPHLNWNYDQILNEVKQYSMKSKSVIYACEDGDGIIVNNEDIRFFGKVLRIEHGNVTTAG